MKTTILMAFVAVILANCGSNATNPNMLSVQNQESKLGGESFVLLAGKDTCTVKENEIAGTCTGKFKSTDKNNSASRYKLEFSLDDKTSSFTLFAKANLNDKGETEGAKAAIKFVHVDGQDFPQVIVTCSKEKTADIPVRPLPAKVEVEVGPHGNHNHVHVFVGAKELEVSCGGELIHSNWGFKLSKAVLKAASIEAGKLPVED